MAASIVLTVGLTMRLYLYEQPIQNEADIMRGSNQQIVLAADPEARLKQLTAELDKLGIKYQVKRTASDKYCCVLFLVLNYQNEGKAEKIILKAHGVDPVKDDVANFLERNHITPPVGTDVELDIRQMPKQ